VMGLKRRHHDVWGEEPVLLYVGSTGIALFSTDPGGVEGNPRSPQPFQRERMQSGGCPRLQN
jgi:hypothetical protein